MSEEMFLRLVREQAAGLRCRAVELARVIRGAFPVRGEPWRGSAAYAGDPHKTIRGVVTACRRFAAALGPLRDAVPPGEYGPGTVAHTVLEVARAYEMVLDRYGWKQGLPHGRVRITWAGGVPPEVPENYVRLAGSIKYMEDVLGRLEPNPTLTAFLAEGEDAAPLPPRPGGDRLVLDDLTQTVALDGEDYPVGDPKTYLLYKAIATLGGAPITRASLRRSDKHFRGDKTIPNLLDRLPPPLRRTIRSGTPGYWLRLPPREEVRT
jgi:hypothetical protein